MIPVRTLLLAFWIPFFSCTSSITDDGPKPLYSTQSDSALHYYQLGWQQIMDQGFYGPAEISYRKALTFDNRFSIGKAVLARLTLNLDERIGLFHEIQNRKEDTVSDERLILDVYNGLVYFTNIRELDPEKAPIVIDSILDIAELNLRQVVRHNPKEIYLLCEYLEIIHSNYGASATLDTMQNICTPDQLLNPFILGFNASMLAEDGQYDAAILKAQKLEKIIGDPGIPKSHAVFADIYFQMDSLQIALDYAMKAMALDPRNLDASRIHDKILAQ